MSDIMSLHLVLTYNFLGGIRHRAEVPELLVYFRFIENYALTMICTNLGMAYISSCVYSAGFAGGSGSSQRDLACQVASRHSAC